MVEHENPAEIHLADRGAVGMGMSRRNGNAVLVWESQRAICWLRELCQRRWVGEACQNTDGGFKPNPWGLMGMHGNVAQWTSSDYKSYPYLESEGRNGNTTDGMKVVRGGSWYDRPYRGTASYRLGYRVNQPVFNVGFRVVCEVQ
jgi:formylglycine-generating enzyme required for sulfatase activity